MIHLGTFQVLVPLEFRRRK